MDDLISRQAAIDELAKMMPSLLSPDGSHPADEEIFKAQEIFTDCIKAIENLPSAQPEIIRCKDCKYHRRDGDGCYYCCRKDYGYGWGLNDFCSDAER